jgi:ADP-heptose:LPS heptosyltransferase
MKSITLSIEDFNLLHYMVLHSIKVRREKYQEMVAKLEEFTSDLGIVDHEEEVQQISEQLNEMEYQLRLDEEVAAKFDKLYKTANSIEEYAAANRLINVLHMYARINHDRPNDYKELIEDYYTRFPNAKEQK